MRLLTGATAAGLLDGLEGAADADGDGTIRVGELMDHIRGRLPAGEGGTTPRLSATAYDRSWPVVAIEPARPGT